MLKEKSKLFCCKEFRLKNQLLIIISSFFTLIVIFLTAINYLHTHIIQSYLSDSSRQIYNMHSNSIIQHQLNKFQGYFTSLFNINGNSLVQFHQLYTHGKKHTHFQNLNEQYQMNYGGLNDIPSIINIPHGIRKYNISYSFLCYSNKTSFHNPISSEEQITLKLQENLQALGQILFIGQATQQELLYSYIKRDNLLMTYPCLQRYDIDDYTPENRTWYIELTKNYLSHNPYDTYDYSITEPYVFFNTTNIGLSIVLPIVDENLLQIGGASIDFRPADLFRNILQQAGHDFLMIYLVSDDGVLIMHPYNVSADQIPLYIYNEAITGFSQASWQLLNGIEENCTDFSHDIMFKCIYNSKMEQTLLASSKRLYNSNISIIILLSSNQFNQFQQEYNNSLLINLQQIFQLQILTHLAIYLLISLLMILAIKKICYPLELIIQILVSEIRKVRYTSEISFLNLTILSCEIKNLYFSCLKFYKQFERFSFKKTEKCELLENFKYPLKRHKFFFSFKNITEITNQEQEQQSLTLDIIKKGIKEQ